jgi:4-hydroxybenzoate polyprenyltransferase
MNKFLSRKFIITLLVLGAGSLVPYKMHEVGMSDTLILAVLGLFTGVGIAYGVINTKDAALDKKDKPE